MRCVVKPVCLGFRSLTKRSVWIWVQHRIQPNLINIIHDSKAGSICFTGLQRRSRFPEPYSLYRLSVSPDRSSVWPQLVKTTSKEPTLTPALISVQSRVYTVTDSCSSHPCSSSETESVDPPPVNYPSTLSTHSPHQCPQAQWAPQVRPSKQHTSQTVWYVRLSPSERLSLAVSCTVIRV